MRSLLLAMSLATAPVAVGCYASAPDDRAPPGSPDGGPSGPSDPPPTEGTPEVSVADLPSSTPYDSIPVRGTGPAGGTVVAETATDSQANPIGEDGTFCIDVPLQSGIANTIWIKAANEGGVFSDVVEVTVRQDGEVPDGDNESEDAPEFENIAAFGEAALHYFGVRNGEVDFLNDDNPDSFVELDQDIFAGGWVVIELTEQAPLHSVRALTTEDCPASGYRAYVISDSDPPVPPGGWLKVLEAGEALDEIKPLEAAAQQLSSTHLAIQFDGGCWYTALTPNFEVVEIEAYAELDGPPQSGGSPEGPTCQSGDAEH